MINGVMETLEQIYASNLSALRKDRHLTQLELAEKLGYSDKSISKWEMGKALPPLEVAKDIAAFFGVSLDRMLRENGAKEAIESAPAGSRRRTNQITIMAMLVCFIFFGAAAIFAYDAVFGEAQHANLWIVFVWAIPISLLVCTLISYRFYHHTKPFWILLSITLWTAFIALPIHFHFLLNQEIWYVILVPIPLQIGILLGMRLK